MVKKQVKLQKLKLSLVPKLEKQKLFYRVEKLKSAGSSLLQPNAVHCSVSEIINLAGLL